MAVIIAGPNGSGKSTAAGALLPAGMKFINADLIAQELSGFADTAADINSGRLLLREVENAESKLENFAFETTLATRMLERRVRRWKELGYQVHIIFFWLPSDELAVERVKARVRAGGHGVPEETVRRRYQGGLYNFFSYYSELVDTWRIFDNTGPGEAFPVAKFTNHEGLQIRAPQTWNLILSRYKHYQRSWSKND